MLWLIVLAVFVIIPLIVLAVVRERTSPESGRREKRTMLYAPGPDDVAGEAYHPSRKDGSMPFPLGKKKERRKTETFRRHSKD